MGRTATQPRAPAAEPALNHDAIEALGAKSTELVSLQAEQAEKAIGMARQIGYEGAMTVGALEDEIRFYQRRTVEAILETGKRLLVLKELTPHGEFKARVELLGFHIKTAQRFMQAAVKTSKSDKLSFLSTQVKSASAFLELVTHDDDVLEGLQEMDDFDRMSASEVRRVARELEADLKAKDEVMAGKDRKLNELARKAKRFNVVVDLPEDFKAADALAAGLKADMLAKLRALRDIRVQAMEERPSDDEGQAVHDAALSSLAVTLRDAFLAVEEELARSMKDFQETIGMFLPD
jgi:hypothetical protein